MHHGRPACAYPGGAYPVQPAQDMLACCQPSPLVQSLPARPPSSLRTDHALTRAAAASDCVDLIQKNDGRGGLARPPEDVPQLSFACSSRARR